MMKLRFWLYIFVIVFAVFYHYAEKHNWNLDWLKPPASSSTSSVQPPVQQSPAVQEVASLPPTNFQKAKQHLKAIYKTEPKITLYCGCKYNEQGQIDWASCGFKPRANAERAKRLEWEHMVPAAFYGRTRMCWGQGGRKHCEQADQPFNNFEGDLHNLRPEVGEINGDRSDRIHAIVVAKSPYGRCDFRIGKDNYGVPAAEPRDEAKGIVARAWLYMSEKHKFHIPEPYRQTFVSWHQKYPVTETEIRMNARIKAIQGDANPYVSTP